MSETVFSNVYEELEWRGLIFTTTPQTKEILIRHKVVCYFGVDPSSSNLHIGNLVGLTCLRHLLRHGHQVIILIGGATGSVGDPSGTTGERKLLSKVDLVKNIESIKNQIENYFEQTELVSVIFTNNSNWLSKISLIDFMGKFGKHFPLRIMLNRESVKLRMSTQSGITLNEFCYQALQAYDYLQLYDMYKCTLQIGGSDQWGNILGGVELIRKMRQPEKVEEQPNALVFPLITDSNGEKFGKSMGNAPTLNNSYTSAYAIYHFFYNTPDDDIIRYLKVFTLLNPNEIDKLARELVNHPKLRVAQKRLAEELVKTIHSAEALKEVLELNSHLSNGNYWKIKKADLKEIFNQVPNVTVDRIAINSLKVGDLLVKVGLCTSISDAKRQILQNSIKLNGFTIAENRQLTNEDILPASCVILKKGKKNYGLVLVAD